jgi:Ca-activated chloride channel homolog
LRRAIFGFLLTGLFLLSAELSAQEAPKPTRKLVLHASVTTKAGDWVGGLTTSNFQIEDKNAPHRVTSSSLSEGPASIGILLDTSGSSIGAISNIQRAAVEFVKASRNQNEYFILTFNEDHYILLDKTTDRERVLKALEQVSSASPKLHTALYDSIAAALEKVESAKYEKKALLVISDGADTYSRHTAGDSSRSLDAPRYFFTISTLSIRIPRTASSMSGQWVIWKS